MGEQNVIMGNNFENGTKGIAVRVNFQVMK